MSRRHLGSFSVYLIRAPRPRGCTILPCPFDRRQTLYYNERVMCGSIDQVLHPTLFNEIFKTPLVLRLSGLQRRGETQNLWLDTILLRAFRFYLLSLKSDAS